MAIYKRDIANINLETGNIHRTFLNHSIGMKDQKADHFGVRVFRDGEPVSLTGVSVQGVFMPPQGSPIAITSGNIVSGNVAEVVLPQACYNYDGQFTLAIKLVDSSNSVTGTVRIVDGMVDNTHASGTVAPTSAVPTYQEVLATYDQAIAAVNTVNTIASDMQIDITASAVSDSNNSYRDLGNRWMTFKRGYYSTPAVGSVSTYTEDRGYIFSIVSCLAGEIVHAHSYGGSSTIAAWAFLDSDMKVVSRGGSGDFNGTQTAPTGSVYVLLNVKLASIGSASYYGYVGNEATKDKISDLKSALDDVESALTDIGVEEVKTAVSAPRTGSYTINSSGEIVSATGNYNIYKASVTVGKKYYVTASGNWSAPLYAYYDSNMDLVQIGSTSAIGSSVTRINNEETIAPLNAAFLVSTSVNEGIDNPILVSNGYALPQLDEIASDVNDLTAAIDEVYKFDIFRIASGTTTGIYSYSLVNGTTYYIRNDGNSSVSVSTCDSSGTIIEVIKNNMVVGETVVFTATQNSNYIRLYAGGYAAEVSIGTDGNVISNVKQYTESVLDDIETLVDDLGGYVDENVTLENTSGKLLTNSGAITDVSGGYAIGKSAVEAGAKYLITASSNWSNPLWGWFDDSMDLVEIGQASASGSAYTVVTDTEVTAPEGAAFLVINWNTGSTQAKLKKKNAKIAGKWYGKKWVCVGDSLTEENIRTTKHYFDYVSEATDITVVNMGVSGTGYKNPGGANNPFYTRVLNVPTDADVVTIFGSFNDGSQDLGTADDTGTSTIGGCINTTLDNLYSVIPTVQLGIVSPTPWDGANPYDHPWSNAYVELLENICKKRSIPFLNLYYESNLRPWDSTFRTLAYSKDGGSGVHPDETGHKIIAPRFEGFLDTLLLD